MEQLTLLLAILNGTGNVACTSILQVSTEICWKFSGKAYPGVTATSYSVTKL